jgi:hypothetical protein
MSRSRRKKILSAEKDKQNIVWRIKAGALKVEGGKEGRARDPGSLSAVLNRAKGAELVFRIPKGDLLRPLAQLLISLTAPTTSRVQEAEEELARMRTRKWPEDLLQVRWVFQRALRSVEEPREPSPEPAPSKPRAEMPSGDDFLDLRGLTLQEIEREAIRLSLRRNHGFRSAVVRELKIAKSTVMKRISEWGLQREGR